MNLPETCPFCGAEPYITASGEQCRGGDRWVLFSCDTSIYAGQDLRRTQSRKCEDAERTRLTARVAELEADSKRLDWLLRRGVAWRDCHNDWWREGEWLYESGNPRSIIDEAMEAKP